MDTLRFIIADTKHDSVLYKAIGSQQTFIPQYSQRKHQLKWYESSICCAKASTNCTIQSSLVRKLIPFSNRVLVKRGEVIAKVLLYPSFFFRPIHYIQSSIRLPEECIYQMRIPRNRMKVKWLP